MSIWYLDTSAAVKLIVDELETEALTNQISLEHPVLTSCRLLETELRRFARRSDNTATQIDVDQVLDIFAISPVTDTIFERAGRIHSLPGRFLRTLDAIHLVAALQLGADVIITYDTNLQDHATALGLKVLAPTP